MKKVFLLILCLFFCFLALGCDNDGSPQYIESNVVPRLPKDAENIHSLGNNWYSFEFENEKFIISILGNPCITQISSNSNTNAQKTTGRCPNCRAKLVATELGFVQVTSE